MSAATLTDEIYKTKLALALADVRRRSECLHGLKRKPVKSPLREVNISVKTLRQESKKSLRISVIKSPSMAGKSAPVLSPKITPFDPRKLERLQLIKEAALRVQAKLETKSK